VPLLTALSATLLVGLCCAVLLFVRRRNDSTTQSKPPDLPHNKYPLQERHYSESSLYFDDSFILSGNQLVVLQTSSDAARVTAEEHRDVRRRLFHDDTPYDEEARDVSADGNN
jgi:sugar diacid utilization regulator